MAVHGAIDAEAARSSSSGDESFVILEVFFVCLFGSVADVWDIVGGIVRDILEGVSAAIWEF